jgi:hypothetical protein
MMKKIVTPVVVLASLCSASAFAAVMAPQGAPAPVVGSQTQQEITQLQQQVAQLRQALMVQAHQTQTHAAAPVKPAAVPTKSSDVINNQHSVFGTLVVTGPSVGLPSHYDGSSLVVNSPSINTDYRLLQRSATESAQLKAHGYKATYPHVVLSGNLEGAASYTSPYTGTYQSDINLTAAELAAYMEITPWVNGFMTISYDDTPVADGPGRVENSRFFLDKGFITIGDLNKSPLYGTIGQQYVPFGRFSHVTISSPLTEYLGRTKVRSALFGFHPNKPMAPYAEVFAFRGATNVNGKLQVNEGGADAGFAFKAGSLVSGDIGLSAISTVSDAQGMLDTGNTATTSVTLSGASAATNETFGGFNSNGNSKLQHRVPALDLHGHLGIGPVTFVGDYLNTLRPFSKDDLDFRGRSAHVSSGYLEADYGVNNLFMGRPATFALSYSTTRQASGLNLPKNRYMAAVQLAIVRDTLLTFGYRYDMAYGKSDTGGVSVINNAGSRTTVSGVNTGNFGKNSQAVTAQLDIYF